jgi:hypothetical protein
MSTVTLMVALVGSNTSMREPNFMIPKRWPASTFVAGSARGTPRARQYTDDLPHDDHLPLPRSTQTSLRSLTVAAS